MNLADRLEALAREQPQAPAIEEADRSTSYAALDRAVWRIAAWLRASDIAPGEVVALRMRSGALRLATGYALARIGAVQLVIARQEPEAYSAAIAQRHGVRTLVADDAPGLGLRLLRPDPRLLDEAGPPDPALRSPGGDRPWILARTSGTTGLPKTVSQSHASFAGRRELARGPGSLDRGDRYYSALAMDFSLGLKMCLDALWVGATVIVGGRHKVADTQVEEIRRTRATYTYLTPTHLHSCLGTYAGPPRLPGLRVLRSGSMAMDEPVRQRVLRYLSPNLYLSYGVNDIDCGITQADPGVQARFPGSVGPARPGVELEVVDESGVPVQPGEVGEVRVRVADMPAGYVDDPAGTARSFRRGWFHPGDLATLSPEGMLTLKGRVDDLVNFMGVKVLPAEIEAVFATHPDVGEVAAFAIPDQRHQQVPAVAVVPRRRIDQDALLRWSAERLGHRAPVVLLVLDTLPRNAMGKVRKQELADLARRNQGRPPK